MKKNLLLSIMAMAVLVTACSDKTTGYQVDINVPDLEKGQPVYLSVMEGKQPMVIDSALVGEKGTAKFVGSVDLPILAQVKVGKKNLSTFFLENSQIKISGLVEQDSIVVAGSAEQDLFQGFLDQLATLPRTREGVAQGYALIAKNNPGSVAAAYIFYRQISPGLGYEEMREWASIFDSTVQKSIYIELVNKLADTKEATSIGKKFIDFSAADTLGNQVALSSVVGKTKNTYVLLDFWASWCPPCRAENPHVVAAFKKYSRRGFTVFGASLDRPGEADKWKEAIVKDKLTWTNVSDLQFWNSAPAALYGVGSIPSNVLIGPDGTIVAKNLRGDGLMNKLKEIYGF